MKAIRIGTDCSGIGAPEQALKNLNIEFETEFACDIDKPVKTTYQHIHGKPKQWFDDVTKRDHTSIRQLDLYMAGFPCQAFSTAGHRHGFDDIRGTVFFHVAEFIKVNQPETFILENVKGLTNHDGGRTFQTVIEVLSGNGTCHNQHTIPFYDDGLDYHIHWQILNTKQHGIPQNRERVFIVGFKNNRDFKFPSTEPLKLKLKDMLDEVYDPKFIVSGKSLEKLIMYNERQKEKGNRFESKFHDPENDVMNTIKVGGGNHSDLVQVTVKANTDKGFEIANEGDSINYKNPSSKTRRGRVGKQIANTIETQNKQAVVQLNQSKESGGQQPYQQNRVYDIDGIAPAMNAGQEVWGGNIVNTPQIRRLTPNECWRLQGFSDEVFHKAEAVTNQTQLYKQAGNSITVRVIQKILNQIFN